LCRRGFLAVGKKKASVFKSIRGFSSMVCGDAGERGDHVENAWFAMISFVQLQYEMTASSTRSVG
jgi:hypothetical protein